MDAQAAANIGPIWFGIFIVGSVIFYGRFYVQWIASERAGRSVMPLVFWYMSSAGSILMMALAVALRSPLGVLSFGFNLLVYGRNLIHIWREQGTLTALRRRLVNGAVIALSIPAVYLLVSVWLGEYHHSKSQPQVWIWLAIGVAGQALFAARFVVQWAATEMKRRSVVPPSFWYLSFAASLMQSVSFLQRHEWIFGIGMLTTIPIYLRNIWMVRRAGAGGERTAA